MSYAPDTVSLLADIGGTNTRVALARGRTVLRDTIRRYANAGHPGLDAVLSAYMQEVGVSDCAGACVAAAGPVRGGVAALTNLDWTIDGSVVAAGTGAEVVAVLNDLQAQGHALGHLASDSVRTVIPRGLPAEPGAAQLVIGVGTGFNAAPVHDEGDLRIVAASECGHASLPVRTADDLSLLTFVERAHGFPGVEDVLSGRGLERVDAWVRAKAGGSGDRKAAKIMEAIAAGTDPDAEATGEVFVRILGTVAGDLSLIHLPFGGVYLIGGVARAFTPHFTRFGLSRAFRDKGRFSDFMQNFEVSVIEDDFAALVGCAVHLDRLIAARS
jgi:glucokinase